MTAPAPEDLDLARADALLQLRIGRSSHYYAVLVSAALAIDGLLVLSFPPSLTTGQFGARDLYFLVPIVVAGLALAIFALRVKWEEYQLWPWELHFWVTVLAVIVNGLGFYLFLGGAGDFGPTAGFPLVPWLLPLGIGGLAMSMAGLALTWTSRSERQLASLVSALLPIPFGFVIFWPGLGHAALINALAISLFLCALFVQTSGSFLHLISSGTRAHEREMIMSGQTKIFVLADQLRQQEDSVRLREAAVNERETAADTADLSIKRRLEAHDEARGHLERMEAEIRQRSEALAKEQTEWAAKAASAQNLWKAAEDKEADLARREAELAARTPGLSSREQAVAAQEGEVARREVELARVQDDATRRSEVVREAEARLETRRLDLERRLVEVLRKESQQLSRETMATASATEQSASAQRLADLEGRETRLLKLQAELDELRANVASQTAELTKSSQALTDRESRHARSEAALAQRAAVVDQREAELAASQKVAETRREEYEQARRGLKDREQLADSGRSEVDRKQAELQRREMEVAGREQQSISRERLLAERQAALDRRERERVRPTGPVDRVPLGAPAVAAAAAPPPAGVSEAAGRRRLADRTSIGAPRLDDLLLGGLPPKAHILLEGPAFCGKEVLLYQFLAEGLKRGEPVVMLAGGRPAAEIAEAMAAVLPDFESRQAKGQVEWVDVSEPPPTGRAGGASGSKTLPASADPAAVLSSLVQAARKAEARHPEGFRVGALGFAHLFAGLDAAKGAAFFQNFVGILKPRPALAAYALDSGVLPEPLIGTLESRVDGVIEFREERGKPQLSVRGLGEVETRDWVEYRTAPQGLTLGSFSLERIR